MYALIHSGRNDINIWGAGIAGPEAQVISCLIMRYGVWPQKIFAFFKSNFAAFYDDVKLISLNNNQVGVYLAFLGILVPLNLLKH